MKDLAARRDSETRAAGATLDRINDSIPMGQPILVGHHSTSTSSPPTSTTTAGSSPRRSTPASPSLSAARTSSSKGSSDPATQVQISGRWIVVERANKAGITGRLYNAAWTDTAPYADVTSVLIPTGVEAHPDEQEATA